MKQGVPQGYVVTEYLQSVHGRASSTLSWNQTCQYAGDCNLLTQTHIESVLGFNEYIKNTIEHSAVSLNKMNVFMQL